MFAKAGYGRAIAGKSECRTSLPPLGWSESGSFMHSILEHCHRMESLLPPWMDVEQLFWRKVRLRCPGGVPTHKQVQVEFPCRSNDEGLRTARMPSASAHVLSRTKRSHGWALQHPSQSCVWKLARLEPSLECHAHPSERPSGSLIGHSRT